jgi:hypothetical protein
VAAPHPLTSREGFRPSGASAMLSCGAVPRPTSFQCSRRRLAEVEGTSSSRDAGRVPSPRGRRERGSRSRPRAEEHQMTRQKSFKRRVRARMDKTSERYTAARRQLLAKAAEAGAEPAEALGPAAPPAPPEAAAAPPAAPGAKGPYSDEVVRSGPTPAAAGTSGSPCWTPGARSSGPIPRSPAGSARSTASAAGGRRGSRSPTSGRAASAPPASAATAAGRSTPPRRWPCRSSASTWRSPTPPYQRIPDPGTADRLKAFWRERVAVLKRVLEEG